MVYVRLTDGSMAIFAAGHLTHRETFLAHAIVHLVAGMAIHTMFAAELRVFPIVNIKFIAGDLVPVLAPVFLADPGAVAGGALIDH